MDSFLFVAFPSRLLFLLLAGGLGVVSRFLLSAWLNESAWCGKPWGILICNLLGCFLFGFLTAFFTRWTSPELKLVILTGFLGAFTTFSSFMFDTVELLEQSRYAAALLNLLFHNGLGIVMVMAGLMLGKCFP